MHCKIMKTRDEFVENDVFHSEEALEAAVDKKKFLLKRLLKHGTLSEDGENTNDDEN